MNKSIPYTIKTNGSVTLYFNGECLTVATDHPNYNKIIDAIKVADFSNIENLVNVAKAVTSYAGNKITIEHGQISYGSFVLHNTLTTRILKMMNEGFKFEHMVKFLENLMQNPSNRAVNETYTFLENYGLPITDDGCFLAYKAVRNNYKDIYSGTLDNAIGSTVSMPRNMVDEVYERDCSTGLHVGALDYVVQYGAFTKGEAPGVNGNKLLIVKVNPKDVVSVPKHESFPKMRVAEYVVVSEIKDIVKELDKVVYTAKATDLTPDNTNTEAAAPTGKIDTTSPWDEAKYREGWDDAQSDLDIDAAYGTSRNYDEVNSYRLGYNDCFNGRANQADELNNDSCSCGEDCSECASEVESDYVRGYTLGQNDYVNGESFQENLDITESDDFKTGYSDGYGE